MAAYTDFTYYTSTYLGTAIAAADFPRLAMRASAVINQITYGRADYEMAVTTVNPDIDPAYPDRPDYLIPVAPNTTMQNLIKMATCAVAEELQTISKNESGGEISSERIGNNSVSYVNNSTAQLSDDKKLARVAKLYLGNTGMMYQGALHAHQR